MYMIVIYSGYPTPEVLQMHLRLRSLILGEESVRLIHQVDMIDALDIACTVTVE